MKIEPGHLQTMPAHFKLISQTEFSNNSKNKFYKEHAKVDMRLYLFYTSTSNLYFKSFF